MNFLKTTVSTNYILPRSAFLAGLFAICSLPVFAQSANTVTIRFGDGDGITGEVIEVTDDEIQLQTTVGSVTLPLSGTTCTGAACPGAARQNIEDLPVVVLSARDGSSQLLGYLLDIVDDQYILATEAGELRLNVSDVNCAGEACLDDQPVFEFGGPVVLASGAITIEGTLTGLDEDAYFLEVDALGALRVSRDFVCNGDGCPPS